MRLTLSTAITCAVTWAAADQGVALFTQRVDEYVNLRSAVNGKIAALPNTATPEQIQNHEQALVAGIRASRSGAKQGDVFVPDVRPMFLSILKANLAGPAKQNNRATARQGNPSRDEKEPGQVAPVIQVNAQYPNSSPLSSVPPALLQQLPKLPKDIEYRFSGNTLLLLDTASNLIIDFLSGAAPGL